MEEVLYVIEKNKKCCCCNYKLARKTSQCATCNAFFFSCILLNLQKHSMKVFHKKKFPWNFCNIYSKTTALEFLFNFIIMRFQHRSSPVYIAKFFKNILKNICKWLLLNLQNLLIVSIVFTPSIVCLKEAFLWNAINGAAWYWCLT